MIPPNEFLSMSATNILSNVAYWCKDKDTFSIDIDLYWKEVQTKARQLYGIVLKTLDCLFSEINHKLKSESECEKVIAALNENGFMVHSDDIRDIVNVCVIVRSNFGIMPSKKLPRTKYTGGQHFEDQMLKCRHASLNCYDYDRLKEEVEQLKMLIGDDMFCRKCSTLNHMLREAQDDGDYPGRHLPFEQLSVKDNWLYQALRIMDKILSTSAYRIKDDDMRRLITNKAQEYGVLQSRWDKSVSGSALKNYYQILANMINVERTRGNKIKYEREVYEKDRLGHRYKMYKDGVRLSAFTFDISLREANYLRKEMESLAQECFANYEVFTEMFPLLSMMGRMEEIALDSQSNRNLLFELGDSDLKSINYYPAQYYEVKKKVEQALALKLPISVKNGRGWEPVMPISIKEQGDRWALMAITPKTKEIRVLSPEMLAQSFADFPELDCDEMVSRAQRQMIGTAPLLKKHPCDIVLTLTPAGLKDVNSKLSVFRDLDFRVMAYKKGRSDQDDALQIEKENVELSIYLNKDFLSEIYRLDCAGKFITMTPSDVLEAYKEYFKGRHGSEWVRYEERAKTKKRLGRPKSESDEKKQIDE